MSHRFRYYYIIIYFKAYSNSDLKKIELNHNNNVILIDSYVINMRIL